MGQPAAVSAAAPSRRDFSLNSRPNGPSQDETFVDAPDPDDHSLVEACKRGDRRAFQLLFERYERKVYAVAYGFLRSQEDALDVVQEAFIKVHRYLPNFEGQSSFYTWLYRIVANLCIDHIRRNTRKKDVEFDDKLRHDGDQDSAPAESLPTSLLGNPGEAVENKEILAAVQDSLKYLSDKHRAVIIMRELQGLSYADMAKAMNCSKGTIMSRLFHARRNMQKLLRERLENLPEPSDDAVADLQQEAAVP
ncbi:MAG: sigma-70 family RNA polymerase sigma factor [Nannocystaceae bacterium]|nr:sigma-70 family RNA polymerase sigma factor [Nannocystaceae bacterium]